MLGLIIGLILVICVLLVLIILAQNSKGGGLSSQFGGSSTSQIMGVKKTGDLLEKLTWGFAIAILVLSLGANKLIDSNQSAEGVESTNVEAARQRNAIQTPNLNQDAIQGQNQSSGDVQNVVPAEDGATTEPIDPEASSEENQD